MSNYKNIFLLSGLVLAASNANAISNGVDTPVSEYKDYLVQLSTSGVGNCGGTLINGRYLVTARHCVDSSTWTSTSNPAPSTMASTTVRQSIIFGDDSAATSFSAGDVVVHTPEATLTYAYYDSVIEAVGNTEVSTECPEGEPEDNTHVQYYDYGDKYLCFDSSRVIDFNDSYDNVYLYDTVVLDLGVTLTQTSSVNFSNLILPTGGENPYHDGESIPASAIPNGATVTFNGWGATASSSAASTLQQMTFTWDETILLSEKIREDGSTTGWDVETYSDRQISVEDPVEASAESGDSGTPFIYDNQVFGFHRGSSVGNSNVKQLDGFAHYLATIVNGLNTVTELNSEDSMATWEFDIQNLVETSAIDVNGNAGTVIDLTFYLDGDDSVFDVDTSNCGSLAIGEFCTVTIIASTDSTGEEIATLSIDYGEDTRVISLTLNDRVQAVSGSKSSGGSMNLWGLIVLLLLGWKRGFTKK